jgi:hypothetical protein
MNLQLPARDLPQSAPSSSACELLRADELLSVRIRNAAKRDNYAL